MTDQLHVCHLVSEYPATSHTFVTREVLALRRAGVDVRTATITRTPEDELLGAIDHEEAATTFAIKSVSPVRLALELGRAALHPGALVAAAKVAWHRRPMGAKGALWAAFYLVEAIRLWVHLRPTPVRHVHAHFANVSADVARLVATFGRAAGDPRWRWSFTMHGPTELSDVRGFGLAGKVEDADVVACISDFCRSQLCVLVDESHWSKLGIVHCGVEPATFATVPAPAAEPGEPLRILCVGRLCAEKGQAVLLEAVAALVAEGRSVRLDLVGRGPRRERLEEEASRLGLDGIAIFHGALSSDDVRTKLGESDVFALASFQEGVPVVLMEAMASGRPVVSTRIAGIPELIEDGVSGFVVAPGRADLVADALRSLEADPALRTRMGAAGRAAVAERYDVDVEARRLMALLSAADGAP